MKNNRYFNFAAAAVLCLLSAVSCYEDLSTEATMEIPQIVIKDDSDVINAYYGEDITVEPSISQKGRNDKDFEFLWEVDLIPGDNKDRLEIGNERVLNYKVGNTPSSKPYILSLYVTDKKTGLQAFYSWYLYVSSSLGEGILVGYTRDGGKTSDMDLVCSDAVTYGYTGNTPRITRELFSLSNGEPVKGRIQTLSAAALTKGSVYGEELVIMGTDRDLVGIDPLSFKVFRKNEDFFTLATGYTSFNTKIFFPFASYSCGLIVNDKLYVGACLIDDYFAPANYSVNPNIVTVDNIAFGKSSQEDLIHFEPMDHKFYSLQGWSAFQSALTEMRTTPSFALSQSECIAAGPSKDSNYTFLMKDQNGKYHFCILNADEGSYSDVDTDADNLDKIVCYTFCDNSGVFFFSDGEKIYSRVVSGKSVTNRSLSWTPDSPDEKITGIKQFLQSWYGCRNTWDYEFTLNTHRTQIIVTTYNEKTKEGKVYLKPYNASTGLFAAQSNGTFGGFGEITAIGTTFR